MAGQAFNAPPETRCKKNELIRFKIMNYLNAGKIMRKVKLSLVVLSANLIAAFCYILVVGG